MSVKRTYHTPDSCLTHLFHGRGGSGTSQMGGAMGDHNSSWEGGGGAQYAAELRILLVYLSESLGRLGQNGGGALRATFFIGGGTPCPPPPVEPPLFHGRGQSQCSLHCAGLVTPECTRGVIDPLYHSRHNGRDRQYEYNRGIRHCNTSIMVWYNIRNAEEKPTYITDWCD